MSRRNIARSIGLFAAVLLLSGACREQAATEKAPPAPTNGRDAGTLPPDHPPLAPSAPRAAEQAAALAHPKSSAQGRIELAPEIKARWRAVTLALATSGADERSVHVTIGGETTLDGSALRLQVLAYVPAFQTNAGVVTSSGAEPKNPAALLRLSDGDTRLVEGWVFQNLPDFNTFASDKLRVRLVGAVAAGQ